MEKYLKANIIISKFCRSYTSLKKDLPIRQSEMAVLNIITKREGNYTPLMIAELLEVTKPMVASHISNLEKKGYIKKEYSQIDKRSFFVRPTKRAIELVQDSEIKLNKTLSNLEDKLGSKRFEELLIVLEESKEIIETKEVS